MKKVSSKVSSGMTSDLYLIFKGRERILCPQKTSVSPSNSEYKTISRIIQIFVADFVASLRDSAQTLFSDFVEKSNIVGNLNRQHSGFC